MKIVLFSDLCYSWLNYKKCSVKISTHVIYSRTVTKHIIPAFPNKKCHDLSESEIIAFINALYKKELSPKSIQDIVVIIKSIVKYGNIMKIMNLTLDLIPCPKVSKAKTQVLDNIEVKKIIQYMNVHQESKNIGIYISLYTGMRLGEICALTWEDIDLINDKIIVMKTMQRIYTDSGKTKVMVTAPKTEASAREVPIPQTLKNEIININNKEGYLLSNNNKCVEPKILQNHFKKIIKSLNFDDYSFHVLRHTFATHCIQCEVDIKSLSEILGHSSVNITLNRYVHSSFHTKIKQINKLNY